MTMDDARLLYRCADSTGEAATWLDGAGLFMWVDIDAGLLHCLDPQDGLVTDFRFPGMVTAIVPLGGSEDEVAVAQKDKILAYNFRRKTFRTLADLLSLQPEWRTNDCKAAPDGRLYCGIMNMRRHDGNGWVVAVEGDGTQRTVLTGQSIPNGMVWHGDAMYYADSGRGCIEEYRQDAATGGLELARTAVRVPTEMGVPDGMTIDAGGNLWVAHWGGACVGVWDPRQGRLLRRIGVDAPNVASCTFDNRGHLLITTARDGLTDARLRDHPLSGSLFVADVPDVRPGENHYPFNFRQP